VPDDQRRESLGLSTAEYEALQRGPVAHLLTIKDAAAVDGGFRYTLKPGR
jgi:hypothetical protein